MHKLLTHWLLTTLTSRSVVAVVVVVVVVGAAAAIAVAVAEYVGQHVAVQCWPN